MSEKREIAAATTNTATAPESAAVNTPPADGNADMIKQVLALIDQIEALIPDFTYHDTNEAKRVANVARAGKDLITQIIATVAVLPPGALSTFDVVEGKDSLTFEADMQQVIQRMSAMLSGTVFTVNSRIARSASDALSTYAWAKKHAKSTEGIELRPFVDEMTSTMKKTLNRRKPAKPAPTPAPKGAQGFLAPNLAAAKPVEEDDYDLPEDFRKELEEALKD